MDRRPGVVVHGVCIEIDTTAAEQQQQQQISESVKNEAGYALQKSSNVSISLVTYVHSTNILRLSCTNHSFLAL